MTTQSVRNYLSGVKYLHVSLGFDFPFYDAPELKLTLCGLERMVKHAPSRAPPVTPSLLRALVQCSSPASAEESDFSCAFRCAFFLFARISNLVPTSAKSFDPTKHLCRGDIVVTSFGLLVTFKWSKTNQSGAKPLTLPLHSVSDPLLCPVRAYLHMCSCLPAPAAAPSFFTVRRSGSYTVDAKAQFFPLFLSSGTASHVSAFLTPLGSGVTLYVEEGLHGPFTMAFRASLIRYMVTGLPMLINVTSNFPRMLSYA